MERTLMFVAVVVVCATSVGCGSIVGSVGGKLPASGGLVYSLPKAVLDVKLTDSDGDLVLTIGEPEYIADERYTYLLQYRPNAFASDTAELTVDAKTNLLQTVNSTAEDKTGQIIVELAKAAAKAAMLAQLAPEKGGIVIFERKIDPADDNAVAALVRDMNAVAEGHATRMHNKNNCSNTKQAGTNQASAKQADTEKADTCASYATLKQGPNISFIVRKPTPLDVEPADCSVGVCYRAPAPYGIEFVFNGQYAYGTIVNLPNDRPAIVLPFQRSAFVQRVNNADFENGMLKKTHIEKPSEALEVAKLPETVIDAIFTSISNLIQLKIGISDKEKLLAQSQTALLQAQKDLQNALVQMERQAAKESRPNGLLSGSSSGLHFAPRVPGMEDQKPSPNPPTVPSNQVSPSNPGKLAPRGKQ
jgi:hypothetical protein